MKKCPYCAEEIQDPAIVCKHCGRDLPGTFEPRRRPRIAVIIIGALLGLLLLDAYVIEPLAHRHDADDARAATAALPSPPAPNPRATQVSAPVSAMPRLLSDARRQFGKPDTDDSTQYDRPRPLMVTRILTYDRARVRLIYVPDAPTVTTPPPYKDWVFVGATDPIANVKLANEEAVRRLATEVSAR